MLKVSLFVCAGLLGARVMGPNTAHAADEQHQIREIEIVVEGGYKPAQISMQEGEHVRLKFIRKEYSGCTKEVAFPTLNIKRELPPNKPVLIDLPALKAGEVGFQCGMNMVKGTITVEPKKS